MTQPATASDSPSSRPQPQRVLACILCQQRKVKCDRNFPCANCLRFGKHCVPASVTPRQRKRRFPERELLDRIRKYEAILQKNHIEFEPLHNQAGETTASHSTSPCSRAQNDEQSENEESQYRPTTATPRESTEAKNLWSVLRQQWSQSSDHASESIHDDVSQALIKKAMDQLYVNNDQLLFGLRHTPVVLSTLHPDPVQIFRLWQIYLNNVDPLLKVTHTPTMQGRIIEAISDLERIPSTLEALMFSIYAISTMSLTVEECQSNLHSSRDELLTQYQFACQQALLNCEYLRTNNPECLTAFYLFLLSIGPNTDPRSLSSMFGVAMRIATRLGIHANSDVEMYPPFEAEMRRRLWWALKLIDSRIGELADSKTIALDPTWDCKIPLNVSDSELRPEMKELPSSSTPTSDSLFVVVRSAIGDLLRHAEFHLDFTNPQLKSVAKGAQQGLLPESLNMAAIERLVEEKYLKFCNPEIPLHLMTLSMARVQLAKSYMLEHYWRYSDSPEAQTDAQRNLMMGHALTVLEYDARMISSPLTKGYCWLLRFYFPFPAYVHILQDLLKRPVCIQAEKAWHVLSTHFEVRVNVPEGRDSPFFDLFTKIVLAAWEKREYVSDSSQSNTPLPGIVSIIKDRVAQRSAESQSTTAEEQDYSSGMGLNGLPNLTIFGLHGVPNGPESRYSQTNTMFGTQPQYHVDTDLNTFHWETFNWPSGGTAACTAHRSNVAR